MIAYSTSMSEAWWATTIAALKHIPDGGRIINISSGAARVSMAGASVYSATKAALDTLTRIWAQDLGKRQITVNGVAPGTTESDMFNAAIPDDFKESNGFQDGTGKNRSP